MKSTINHCFPLKPVLCKFLFLVGIKSSKLVQTTDAVSLLFHFKPYAADVCFMSHSNTESLSQVRAVVV